MKSPKDIRVTEAPYLCDMAPDLAEHSYSSVSSRMLMRTELTAGQSEPFWKYMDEFDALSPDVILFTANSAIPVADSVRGWHDAMGTDLPEFSYVDSNGVLTCPTETAIDTLEEAIDSEAKRLGAAYAGASVAIIDQYIHSGNTLRVAKAMAERAGMLCVGATSEVRWFNHAQGKTDRNIMSSGHAEFMRDVGMRAIERSTMLYLDQDLGD